MTLRQANIHNWITSEAWLISPSKMGEIMGAMDMYLQNGAASDSIKELYASTKAVQTSIDSNAITPINRGKFEERGVSVHDNVAVVPVYGTLGKNMSFMDQFSGATSTKTLIDTIDRLAAEPNISSVVFDFNSGGGSVHGTIEVSDAILKLSKEKNTFSVANDTMASAAYWIGSSADQVYVATETSGVGSIGVYQVVYDKTAAMQADGVTAHFITAGKYKAVGMSERGITAEEIAHLDEGIQRIYDLFVKHVSSRRSISESEIRNNIGASMQSGSYAVSAKLADGVMKLDEVIAMAKTKRRKRKMSGEQKPSNLSNHLEEIEMTQEELDALKADIKAEAMLEAKAEAEASLRASIKAELEAQAATENALKAKTEKVEKFLIDNSGRIQTANRESTKTFLMSLEGEQLEAAFKVFGEQPKLPILQPSGIPSQEPDEQAEAIKEGKEMAKKYAPITQ